MSQVSTSELLAAFDFTSEATVGAKDALISGAPFQVWLDPVPASRLLGICRQRMRTLERRGVPTSGAAECLESLAERGEHGLLVAYLDDRQRKGRYFRLYLDPHPLRVIGCIEVAISPIV
ncbi:hypothetical protein ACFW93_24480 [Streptomyces canus]|uniref:hypothetical protein n=1 Tax=Streptomyces canus TaxID=58343 RepID=UPI00369D9E87